jgi:hypothetical protein
VAQRDSAEDAEQRAGEQHLPQRPDLQALAAATAAQRFQQKQAEEGGDPVAGANSCIAGLTKIVFIYF